MGSIEMPHVIPDSVRNPGRHSGAGREKTGYRLPDRGPGQAMPV